MRSARSASRLVVEGLCWWPRLKDPGGKWPRWPSLIAVVESAEREVVVLVGVPLKSQDGVSFISISTNDVVMLSRGRRQREKMGRTAPQTECLVESSEAGG